jgi:SAM-dependent methyltransferase
MTSVEVDVPRTFARFVKPAALGLLAVLAVAVVLFGPGAAFHRLPPEITGEAARLSALLELGPGKVVADIGAGTGSLSVALARRLEPGGRLYATERSPALRTRIAERAERARLSNVTVVEAGEAHTALPDACCDAIVLRDVYHHVTDPASFNRSLASALRPDGRLAIIDFAPGTFWHLRSTPTGVARTGHGVDPVTVADELQRAGFRVERRVDDWGGWTYLILFRVTRETGS